jgi:propanediol utilization protein
MSTLTLDRAVIERLVREALKANGAVPSNGKAKARPGLVVNVSARHCHVTPEDLEVLYGPGHKLTPYKALYQDGFFAAEETVTLVGPRQRLIHNLRILGPCRDHTQVELAFSDAIMLGLDVPVRKSGSIADTPGAYLIGPAGMVRMERGVIRHERHVHMGPEDAAAHGVKDGERLHLRVKSDCSAVLEDLLVRVAAAAKLEVHLDTDEGNACNLSRATKLELFR